QKIPGRVLAQAVAERLLAVEGGQRRAGAEQADQVDAQAGAQLAMLMEQFNALDIGAREPHARVGTELEALVQGILIQMGVRLSQLMQHQLDALEQAVFPDVATQAAQSRGCNPM